MSTITADPLVTDLLSDLRPDAVTAREIDTARMAHDASHFLLQPRAVVFADGVKDVARALRRASEHRIPVTFRSGGTSLSGQAQTDGLLIDTRKGFRGVRVLDGGARVRSLPGTTVRIVNAYLKPYGRALGPDPASETACTIGGVVADNSSGMLCGTEQNSYRTIDSMEILLPSGTRIDTGESDADERLAALEPQLHSGLARLRDRVRANPESVARVTQQFSMKNTMGYGLNSFLDHDRPVDILAHLMIGSEGTLGFLASVTFRTVPVHPLVATALLVFDSIDSATRALPDLIDAGTATAELMDAASLRVAQALPSSGDLLTGLEVERHTALLVEAQADTDAELRRGVDSLAAVVRTAKGLTLSPQAAASESAAADAFSTDPARRAQAWAVRKGLYTAVAGARPTGSTALLEDVVVPLPALPDAVAGLQEMCSAYGYDDAVVFGHAKDANLHFMINPDLRDPAALDTYARFTEDLVDLILGADGSLKAEHGTGRIMAPYVRRQFGDELYEVMVQLKRLCDPHGLLNPGVILTDDAEAHLHDLKRSDPVDPLVDRCVECGYCEPVCPSRDVTTTPRQRIVLMREMNQADPARRAEIAKDFDYMAIDTCAADSMCVVNCPVSIDTGVMMKKLRAQQVPAPARKLGEVLAERWGTTTDALRGGVGLAGLVPGAALGAVTDLARRVLPTDLVPRVGEDLPAAGTSRRTRARKGPGDVVFFPSCLGEIFGPQGAPGSGTASTDATGTATGTAPGPARDPLAGSPGVTFAFLGLCDAAGVPVHVPEGVEGLCCGTVWRSKGLSEGAAAMARRTATTLLEATDDGRIPVVADSSSCLHGLGSLAADLRAAVASGEGEDGDADLAHRVEALEFLDVTAFVLRSVLPKLDLAQVWDRAVVHPTCSDVHGGTAPELVALAEAVAREVVVPVEVGCCGFAGDRGMLHPELTAAATAREAAEVATLDGDVHLSTNRTCEMGMTRATGRPYHHVLEALFAAGTRDASRTAVSQPS